MKVLLAVLCSLLVRAKITQLTPHTMVQIAYPMIVFFHNPECVHSKTYAESYMRLSETDSQAEYGIVDCALHRDMCTKMNITKHPTVARIAPNQPITIQNEESILVQAGLKDSKAEKVQLSLIVDLLKTEPFTAVIVLEEDGFPVTDRVPTGVFYFPHTSELHGIFTKLLGGRPGCWIIDNSLRRMDKLGNFEKYYCSDGYRAAEVQRHVEQFQSDELEKYEESRLYLDFKSGGNSYNTFQEISVADLTKSVNALNKTYESCKLIYFYSESCRYCSATDVEAIKSMMVGPLMSKLHLYVFNVDGQEITNVVPVKRVPELVAFCKGRMLFYQEIFLVKPISEFISSLLKPQVKQEQL